MRKNVIIKALVLGFIGCAFTITGMAGQWAWRRLRRFYYRSEWGKAWKQFVQIGWIAQILL